MADILISELPATTEASDSSYLPIDNGNLTEKITVANFNANANATAKYYAEQAQTYAGNAATSATSAQTYAGNAATSATNASASASAANTAKTSAQTYAGNASASADSAANSASSATAQAQMVSEYTVQAEDAAQDSEAWAIGRRNGSDVEPEDPTYENNAKFYAELAVTSASTATTSASTATTKASEASTSATSAATSATTASNSATTATTKASEAVSSASTASTAASTATTKASEAATSANTAKTNGEDSEAWAWGKIDGVDVPSTHPAYHNNAKYWADNASGSVSGVASFNGRAGIVVPSSGDYSANMVSFNNGSSSLSATNVQGAIEELESLAGSLGTAAAKDSTNSVTQNSTDLVESGAVYTEMQKAYQSGDSAETAIDDADYIPFYDTSASGKRKSLWSNIKSVLKTYFDTLYKGINAHDTWSEVSSKPFSTIGAGLTVTNDALTADAQSITVETTGTASATTASYQRIGVNGSYYEIIGTKYMEASTYLDTSDRRFQFNNALITADAEYSVSCDVPGVSPTRISRSSSATIMYVYFNISDNVTKCRLYIR